MTYLRTVDAPRAIGPLRYRFAVSSRTPSASSPHRILSFPRRAAPAESEAATGNNAKEREQASSNVCQTCGVALSEMPGGCDGKGRQAGGVGAFIDWWPIKAYRPCPALTASGGKYKRKGQITDEMLFGKGKR
mmetsp:Transcript_15615/g.27677  ORF Transcript_15615/g.27677 Transcript_15615/m.27677 type:complete len:133 (-) Transcript_15615:135-533(-)|eukprot:CAMPEP_0168609126 /NCGR_PEP_ID=MMETSP0449_2-20121227/1029_1 /TAXON_ID=1082188 /ORGANISM="Strombidium rassoulzadegani, Strain ras09" /LENGTH=132 /DNA_ID=CAMNT_0008649227 /DNA_START=129 /DNA_END=527 /DNA_ORIENTATION=-